MMKRGDWGRSLRRLRFTGSVFLTAGLVLLVGAQVNQLLGVATATDSGQPGLTKPVVKGDARHESMDLAKPKALALKQPVAALASPAVVANDIVSVGMTIPNQVSHPAVEATPKVTVVSEAMSKGKFGHLPYEEALPESLVGVGKFEREGYEREEVLEGEAAQVFELMKAAARSQGVELMVISGFRNVADQQFWLYRISRGQPPHLVF